MTEKKRVTFYDLASVFVQLVLILVLGFFAATCCTGRYPWETRHAPSVPIQQ